MSQDSGELPRLDRFRIHLIGSGRSFLYEFYDDTKLIEKGEATSPRVIEVLFNEFRSGRLSVPGAEETS